MKTYFVILLAALVAAGCGYSGETIDRVGQGDGAGIPPRYASVISSGCTPDAWQSSTLASDDMRRVVKEVVLLCGVARVGGTIGPADTSARQQLADVAKQLRGEGYKVKIAVSFTDETRERYDGTQAATLLADAVWRKNAIASIYELVTPFDGVELDLQKLPARARNDLSAFVKELAAQIRPGRQIVLLAPPSTREPSDTPGGEAFDLAALSQWVDRVRVMTLDFSDPNAGPTVEPGWAVDAVRFARSKVGHVPVDVAMPLYGNDTSNLGVRSTTWLEARAIADEYRLETQVGPTGAKHIAYTDAAGRSHQLWYDDAESTSRTLRAWDSTTLPLEVGVVFYGLGAEDPALWSTLARATR